MKVTELASGDAVLVQLLGIYKAKPTMTKNGEVYTTGIHQSSGRIGINEFEGIVTRNDIISKKFYANVFTRDRQGSLQVEVDYIAVKGLWKWEGETNVETVARSRQLDFELLVPVEDVHDTPPIRVYRIKVDMRV